MSADFELCKNCRHPKVFHQTFFLRKYLGIFGLRELKNTNCKSYGCNCKAFVKQGRGL